MKHRALFNFVDGIARELAVKNNGRVDTDELEREMKARWIAHPELIRFTGVPDETVDRALKTTDPDLRATYGDEVLRELWREVPVECLYEKCKAGRRMLDRPPSAVAERDHQRERRRLAQRRYRQRIHDHARVAPVAYSEAELNYLIKLHWLQPCDADSRTKVGDQPYDGGLGRGGAVTMWREAMTRPIGHPVSNTDNVSNKPDHGNSRACTLVRLKHEKPELYGAVVAGQMSANVAAIEAGFRKLPSSLDQIKRLLPTLSTDERQELRALLDDA